MVVLTLGTLDIGGQGGNEETCSPVPLYLPVRNNWSGM